MISNIDSSHNAELLKIAYFSGHINVPYPPSKGGLLIDTALMDEQVGTFRWYLLQMVRGYAGFKSPGVEVSEGFDAYMKLFEKGSLANTIQKKLVVQKSIQEALYGISTSLKEKWFLSDPRVSMLLLRAWEVNQQLQKTKSSDFHSIPLNWSNAVTAAHAEGKFTTIVEDALNNRIHSPDFSILKLAVVVLQDKDPKRAIDLLETAQHKLQPDDHYNQKWLYDTWRKLIASGDTEDVPLSKITDKSTLTQLAAMRKQQISYTGTGYADLLELYWKLHDQDKAAEVIKTAQLLNIPQKAIAAIGTKLLLSQRYLKFSKDKTQQLQKQGVALLQKYLTSSQTLQPNPEISARLSLGRYYVKQDLITQALKALDISHIKKPPPYTEASIHYNDLLRLKATLDKKLQGV